MIWRFGQYVPVCLFTAGAAIVSTSTAWETASRGSWWLPALGLCLLALAVEVLKPVAVARRMWWFATACVLISGMAEFQTIARGRSGYADSRGAEAKDYAANTVANHRTQLEAIQPARSSAELQPLIAAAERAAGACPVNMGPVQREACRSLPLLQSEAARAGLIEGLRAKIEAGGGRVVATKGASEEATALAAIVGWLGVPATAVHVDQMLALLLIALFQVASVGSAACLRTEPTVPATELEQQENVDKSMSSHVPASVPVTAIPAPDPDQELLAVFLRGKGGLYSGSQRSLTELLGWGRNKYDRVIREAKSAGLVKVTERGVELIERKA